MIRQYNEVKCNICHKTKATDIGKVPIDMVAQAIVDTNVHYENREHKYEDIIKEIVIVGDIEHTSMSTTNTRKVEYIGDKCPEGLLEEEIVLFGSDKKLIESIRRLNDEN